MKHYFMRHRLFKNTRCVHGNSRNDFIASLLRGVTFEVLHSRSSALSPTMLTLSETFLKILLWIAFSDVVTFF